jgi:type II secretory ATPase GspE/PulE/Tfp pilus assembly ATPase PilB-like protein
MVPNAVALVDDLITKALLAAASDLHLEPGSDGLTIRLRLDGVLNTIDHVPASIAANVVARLKVMGELLTYRTDIPQEGSFLFKGVVEALGDVQHDVRLAVFPTIYGERAVLRFFCDDGLPRSIDHLGLGNTIVQSLKDASEQTSGLILVTGPSGAGKSTTLYTIARHILETTPGRSVVSLEDPVEQRVDGLTQIQVQPFGELNYARAMRSLLRQDVEVLFVGEIRDAESAHIVIEAALTGHLVLSTLHSGDPAETIARLIEMGIAPYQLTSTLRLIHSQRLLRKMCFDCHGSGCERCLTTGYRNRTACAQVAAMDDALRQLIVEHAPTVRLRTFINEKSPNLHESARSLVESKQTTTDEVRRVLGTIHTQTADEE